MQPVEHSDEGITHTGGIYGAKYARIPGIPCRAVQSRPPLERENDVQNSKFMRRGMLVGANHNRTYFRI